MKWSRNDEAADGGVVLMFPSGLQMKLEQPLPGNQKVDAGELPVAPASTMPLPRPAGQGPAQPIGLDASSVRAMIAWNMAGLSLFAGGRRPTMDEAVVEAERVLLAEVMERHCGNITRAAAELKTSRRSLRTRLKKGGMYDWSRVVERDEGDLHDEGGAAPAMHGRAVSAEHDGTARHEHDGPEGAPREHQTQGKRHHQAQETKADAR